MDVAREAQKMGQNSDSKVFQQIAMVSIGVMVVASVGHLLIGCSGS